MSANVSAGLMMYRIRSGRLDVFLVHPGGPFYARRDEGVWSIPKGLAEPGEDLLQTAVREFEEETGMRPQGPFLPLGAVRQKSGKRVHAWAFAGEWDAAVGIRRNTFSMEWPRGSGQLATFPEADRAEFFSPDAARQKIIEAQRAFIDRLEALASRPAEGPCDEGLSAAQQVYRER